MVVISRQSHYTKEWGVFSFFIKTVKIPNRHAHFIILSTVGAYFDGAKVE